MGISLVSVNVERSKHLQLVLPFLDARKADIVCVQELHDRDIPQFESVAGPLVSFAPMTRFGHDGKPLLGIGMFSRRPFGSVSVDYYRGSQGAVLEFDEDSPETKYETERAMCIFADIDAADGVFRVGTTHFTWTPDGRSNAQQWKDLSALTVILEGEREFVLAGDFNAPRGGDIFTELAKRYRDNIPSSYRTSIDVPRHRLRETKANELSQNMVDGLFTTPAYSAHDVFLVDGVSDHMAIVAQLERA